MKKLVRWIIQSLIVLTFGSLLSLAQQLEMTTSPQTLPSVPIDYLLTIQMQVGGTNPNLRAYVDDIQLSTVVLNWQFLLAYWHDSTFPGAHALKVADIWDPSIFSNTVTMMVGQAPNVQVCAGGLLPQDADLTIIAQYVRTYNVLNCRYIDPPRCATGHIPTSALDCTE